MSVTDEGPTVQGLPSGLGRRWVRDDALVRRLAVVVRDSNDAIMVQDLHGRLEAWNHGAVRMYGYTEAEALRMNSRQLIPPAERSRFARLVRDALSGREVDSVEVQRVDKNGRLLTVWLTITKLVDEHAKIAGFATTERDVTRHKQMATDLLESQAHEVQRLKERDEFTTHFLNNAAHELNTPLTAIKIQLHLLKERGKKPGANNPGDEKAIDMLDRNVERLAGLVSDLIDAAKLHAGRLKFDLKPVSLNGLVAHALAPFEAGAKRRGLRLEFRPGADVHVMADEKRAAQVVVNLLNNAFKFTPPGGHIVVGIYEESGLGLVKVLDDGIGLRPEDIDKLFRPFSQLNAANATGDVGNGLGLYISKGILEAQGGTMWCESPGPRKGSTFGFSLPTATATSAVAAPLA